MYWHDQVTGCTYLYSNVFGEAGEKLLCVYFLGGCTSVIFTRWQAKLHADYASDSMAQSFESGANMLLIVSTLEPVQMLS